jgi:hypothetical protein
MTRKYKIQVRRYPPGSTHHSTDKFDLVETVERSLWGEQVGNFNPLFCQYKGERMLVFSDEGDLSDPFRREKSYENNLFVELKHETKL